MVCFSIICVCVCVGEFGYIYVDMCVVAKHIYECFVVWVWFYILWGTKVPKGGGGRRKLSAAEAFHFWWKGVLERFRGLMESVACPRLGFCQPFMKISL